MGKELVSTRVLGQLEEAQNDPIANVRLNIAKALGQLRDQFTEDARAKRVVPLLEKYSKDTDHDVSFFAKAALAEMQWCVCSQSLFENGILPSPSAHSLRRGSRHPG